MATEVISYDFETDAMGLGDFIQGQIAREDVSPVVYVVDGAGRPASRAEWIISTLTDGSKTAELFIHFED